MSFATYFRASNWSDKNAKLPSDYTKGSHVKVWFKCDKCPHEFESIISDITIRGAWCPYCANRKLCQDSLCDTCHDKSFASHEKCVFWSSSNPVAPREVFKGSFKKFIFNCYCLHDFESSLVHIKSGSWCPFCANHNLCQDLQCETCFDKSFASHEKSAFFHSSNCVKPREIFKNCSKKFRFQCDKCHHEFDSKLNHITSGRWCPYCSNNKLCESLDCQTCHDKSLASHPKSIHWCSSNSVLPREVFRNSRGKFRLKCDQCLHEFDISPSNLTYGNWCPFCANSKLCTNLECEMCNNKSFSSHPKSIYWSSSNIITPRDVFLNCHTKFEFECDKCKKVFMSRLTHINAGQWCPWCTRKTESLLNDWLEEWFGKDDVKSQFKLKVCINKETGKFLPFDFCIVSRKIITELDGGQHFFQVGKWKSPEYNCANDKYKMRHALDAGYKFIRVCQQSVWKNPDKWKKILYKVYFEDEQHVLQFKSDNPNLYDKHKEGFVDAEIFVPVK